ncbi:MAG TPA: primary-amine oxidase [Pyrinomonadaceae bacterium]|nr:primary-amine oxidase [Pyrinomonadaceae bacterium]
MSRHPRGTSRSRSVLLLCAQLFVLSALSAQIATAQPRHPLDPLSADEIKTASKILGAHAQFPEGAIYSTIVLKEPAKGEVLGFRPGAQFSRQAFAVILDRRGNRTFEAVVDLKSERLVSWKLAEGAQPLVTATEFELLPEIVKRDERWRAAMRKRGIEDFEKVQIDGWAVGQVAVKFKGPRLLRALTYLKGDEGKDINFYGQPVEGVIALVNMNTEQVVEVTDTGVVPLPPPSQQLDEKSTGTREAPKPLDIKQPRGASFTLDGQEVRWQKWRFRYTMHPREGLVLHTVGYEDAGRVRPILYRASLSEMVVPYGDTDKNWGWRSAFDVGEYSVGRLASSIEERTDAPENATLIDATFAGDDGQPEELKRAVGIYERDGGMLWKHYESYSEKNESRRARQLVIFFIATIGNYDYAVNWVFHQDGTLEADAALSGIMLPKGVRELRADEHGSHQPSGHLVAARVVAPHHQHFFNFRLDFDVDGQNNSVHEMNTRAVPPGRANPNLNGMLMEETLLRTEREAQRKMDMRAARTWAVVNPSARNSLGHHTSYILVPGANSLPYVAPTSQVRRRAGFINNHFWATRYDAEELSAAGTYPNQSAGGDGLPRWVADGQSLVNADVVVWYTLGVTHIPRPEEWPVMPVTHVGFKLIPGGFFSRNPALDVPR